jgi:hypothetical protein
MEDETMTEEIDALNAATGLPECLFSWGDGFYPNRLITLATRQTATAPSSWALTDGNMRTDFRFWPVRIWIPP